MTESEKIEASLVALEDTLAEQRLRIEKIEEFDELYDFLREDFEKLSNRVDVFLENLRRSLENITK